MQSSSRTPTTEWIFDNAPRMEPMLMEWCSVNSGSGNRGGLAAMLRRLTEAFAELPCSCSEVDLGKAHAPAFQAVCRPEAPVRILLNGHMDTVYEATHSFQTCRRLDSNRLNGPGTADMKGGLIVLLHALQAFERSPLAERIGWEVFICPDEETGSQGSAPWLIANAERFKLGLVFEPATEGKWVRNRMGTGTFTATCHGRAAHAGRARTEGRNAIVALSRFLIEADSLNAKVPAALLNVGNVSGGGAVNIVPHLARAEINLRAGSLEAQATIERELRALAAQADGRDGCRLEITGQFNRPPKVVGPVEERLFELAREEAAAIGMALEWTDVGGGSDGNILSAAGLPVLDGIGPCGGELHSDREYVELDSLPRRAALVLRLLERIARGDGPL